MALSPQEKQRLKDIARELRLTVIDVMAWSGGAHVGGSLSIIDILTILYFKYLDVNPADPQWDERDRFILSKGHAAAGLIPVLAKRGFFPEETLKTFNHFGSPFAMHPDSNKVIGCDASAGSLGHGLSMAVGMALGARQRKMPWKTVCLMGDGECCEGSIWEAAMSAPHFKLGNLIGIVDRNRFMIDGETEDVMPLEPFADKWRAFGWEVVEVDGHDFDQLDEALAKAWAATDVPVLILANTIKGKGVDFMENNVVYHYASADSELCARAKASILKEG
ncbi:MAG TPA: transketolase [Candidatus Pullichristensenella excrementipullorum]|nr:transketolase [Candidatus Pullichristensenella excrementipullorum]